MSSSKRRGAGADGRQQRGALRPYLRRAVALPIKGCSTACARAAADTLVGRGRRRAMPTVGYVSTAASITGSSEENLLETPLLRGAPRGKLPASSPKAFAALQGKSANTQATNTNRSVQDVPGRGETHRSRPISRSPRSEAALRADLSHARPPQVALFERRWPEAARRLPRGVRSPPSLRCQSASFKPLRLEVQANSALGPPRPARRDVRFHFRHGPSRPGPPTPRPVAQRETGRRRFTRPHAMAPGRPPRSGRSRSRIFGGAGIVVVGMRPGLRPGGEDAGKLLRPADHDAVSRGSPERQRKSSRAPSCSQQRVRRPDEHGTGPCRRARQRLAGLPLR